MKVQSSKSFHFYGICALMVTLVRLDIYTLIHTLDYISIYNYHIQSTEAWWGKTEHSYKKPWWVKVWCHRRTIKRERLVLMNCCPFVIIVKFFHQTFMPHGMPKYTCECTNTYIHIHSHIHTSTRTHIHRHMHAITHTHTHAHICTQHTYTYTTHTKTDTCEQTHVRKHKHTQT